MLNFNELITEENRNSRGTKYGIYDVTNVKEIFVIESAEYLDAGHIEKNFKATKKRDKQDEFRPANVKRWEFKPSPEQEEICRIYAEEQWNIFKQSLEAFCEKYPDWQVAEAYQTYGLYLLSNKPEKFIGNQTGTYGRGANLLLEDCPKKLLFLAEDD
jgi:hypothetical protein